MANENNVRFSLAAVMLHSSFAQTLRRKLHFPYLCSGNFTLLSTIFSVFILLSQFILPQIKYNRVGITICKTVFDV